MSSTTLLIINETSSNGTSISCFLCIGCLVSRALFQHSKFQMLIINDFIHTFLFMILSIVVLVFYPYLFMVSELFLRNSSLLCSYCGSYYQLHVQLQSSSHWQQTLELLLACLPNLSLAAILLYIQLPSFSNCLCYYRKTFSRALQKRISESAKFFVMDSC